MFNKYKNIFPLEENMRVRSNTPLNSYLTHRFAYIIQDKNFNQPKVIRILPYLHTRMIFLNQIQKNTNYFYTSIETSIRAEKLYNQYKKDKYIEPNS